MGVELLLASLFACAGEAPLFWLPFPLPWPALSAETLAALLSCPPVSCGEPAPQHQLLPFVQLVSVFFASVQRRSARSLFSKVDHSLGSSRSLQLEEAELEGESAAVREDGRPPLVFPMPEPRGPRP